MVTVIVGVLVALVCAFVLWVHRTNEAIRKAAAAPNDAWWKQLYEDERDRYVEAGHHLWRSGFVEYDPNGYPTTWDYAKHVRTNFFGLTTDSWTWTTVEHFREVAEFRGLVHFVGHLKLPNGDTRTVLMCTNNLVHGTRVVRDPDGSRVTCMACVVKDPIDGDDVG